MQCEKCFTRKCFFFFFGGVDFEGPAKEGERLTTQMGTSCVDTTDDISFTSSLNGQGELNPTPRPSVLENLVLERYA